jgi:phosphoenolpyruvate phosphomutase
VYPDCLAPLPVLKPNHHSTQPAGLKELLNSDKVEFFMEAHNGLSAKIVEEAGFAAIWASGLSMSAALGVRDCNEASWTQVLEVVEFMRDATPLPILLDGDSGFGNFNNVRRLVRKLEQRGVDGVCIEDQVFPKRNSLSEGRKKLVDPVEFTGKIKAGKDTQSRADFCIVARLEGFIAGAGLGEVLRRAHLYADAGADALLVHSKRTDADEVLAFASEWQRPTPLIVVPTTFHTVPTPVFARAGFSAVIWANYNLRSSITAMQETCRRIFEEQSVAGVAEKVAPLREVFRLQNTAELVEAEKRYLPKGGTAESEAGPSTAGNGDRRSEAPRPVRPGRAAAKSSLARVAAE